MAIVKMKRLRLLGMEEERDKLLKELQLLGCVEISRREASDEPGVALVKQSDTRAGEFREDRAKLESALKILDFYSHKKTKLLTARPEHTAGELFDEKTWTAALQTAGKLNDRESKIRALYAEESRQRGEIASLTPWETMDEELQLPGTADTVFAYGTLPAGVLFADVENAVCEKCPLVQLSEVSADKTQTYLSVIAFRDCWDEASEMLRSFGFSRMTFEGCRGTASGNIAELRDDIAAEEKEIAGYVADIAACDGERDRLKLCIDRSVQEIQREEAKERLLVSGRVFGFEGWAPAPDEEKIKKLLDGYTAAYEFADPEPEDNVPIKLKNNAVTEPLMVVTEMYSLPSYDGVDPNPLMMPFFTLFFGIMFADMGYGILMLLASLIITKKVRPKGTLKYMLGILRNCSITTILFGFLTGSFFGDAIEVVAAMYGYTVSLPRLFSPLEDPLLILIGSLALGGVQLLTGMAIGAWMSIRDGHWKDALFDVGSWWLLFAGIAVGALKGNWYVALAGVAALVLTQGRSKKGIFAKLASGVGSLYNITSYLGDVLSYSRIMALMLAGSVIASVVNKLGSLAGSIVVFVIIFLIGHTFNIGLNLISAFVHTSRLQFLEFFGKFYRDGGKPFRPLAINTKYVDIIEEEK